MTMLDMPGDLLAFTRGRGPERRLCLFNLGFAAQPWTAPDGWAIVERVNLANGEAGPLPPLAGLILAPAA